jgi:CRP-like cAMP-binding protein
MFDSRHAMTSSIFEQLDFSGLFREFPQDTKQQLADISTTVSCSDGQMLYQNGDQPDALYGVLSGGIKMVAEDANGKYFLYGIVQPGWWFGEISAIDGRPRAQTTMAIGDTQLMRIPRKELLNLLDTNPKLYKHFLDILCKRLRQAGQVLEEAAFLPLSKRLAKQLLRLHKSRRHHDASITSAKISQEELAASLGVTRQSIYRVLKDWQLKNWIAVQYGNIEITEPESLQTFLNLSEH